ncbi:MAG: isoprenyl transferase [Clostridia bacterium]|nr:isoprenyl transferase [Clostridia bacterium]
MFFDKLTRMLNDILRPKPKYITVTPVNSAGPVQALPPSKLPRHVAIIMDGNGRWATSRGLPRSAGHAAGTEALRDIIRASDDYGIEALSLYAFSTENWSRSKEEIQALMSLLLKYFNSEIDELDEKHVKITILGDVDGMPEPQRTALINAMERTKNNTGLKLNIALNYGGRAELTRAARLLAERVQRGELAPEDIDEDLFAAQLYTAESPDVDLLIRTSGEMRTSNFLPWQLTYAEMVFDTVYWPDFDRARYLKCLRIYAERDRRFGGVNEPPKPSEVPAAEPKAEDPEPVKAPASEAESSVSESATPAPDAEGSVNAAKAAAPEPDSAAQEAEANNVQHKIDPDGEDRA